MAIQNWLSAVIAVAITVYFWRVNTKGIHESSDQALKIMGATTVMGGHHDRLVPGDSGGTPEKRHLPRPHQTSRKRWMWKASPS